MADYEDYAYDEAIALRLTFDLMEDGSWFADVSEGYSGSTTSFVNATPLELIDGALEWAQSTVTVAGAGSFMEGLEGLDALKSDTFEVQVYIEPRALLRLLAAEG